MNRLLISSDTFARRGTSATRAFERCVDEDAAKLGWRGSMMSAEFEAPELLDLAKLGAWTLKSAILHA